MRARPQKLAGLRIEDPLVDRAAVRTDQVARAGAAVFQRNLPQGIVSRGVRGPEDNADIHHDVDEQRLRAHKGGQISAGLPA